MRMKIDLINLRNLYSNDDKIVLTAINEKKDWINQNFYLILSLVNSQDIADLFDEQDMKEVNSDISIVDMVISVGAASSKREAREFITSGAVSLNGNKITDINQIISADMFIDNTYVIIKRGKKNYYVGKNK